MLQGSTAVGIRGEKRLGSPAAPRCAPLLERRTHSRYETSGSGIRGRLITPLTFMPIAKGSLEPRTNRYANNSETGEEGGKGTKVGAEWSSGLWKTPRGPRRKTEQKVSGHSTGSSLGSTALSSANSQR